MCRGIKGSSFPIIVVWVFPVLLEMYCAASIVDKSINGGNKKPMGLHSKLTVLNASVEPDSPGPPLTVLDCVLGNPDQKGLVCSEEGYFISSFQNTVFWTPGDLFPNEKLAVPASSAICCSLKMPDSLPSDPTGAVTPADKPVAIVSIGCHSASNTGYRTMQCEHDGDSFISGFLDGGIATYTGDVYYPVDSPECCTPVVLLSSGDAWELKRCNCHESDNVNCQGEKMGQLLQGFNAFGKARGHHIPVAPALCCNVCLGNKVHDMSKCQDLSYCNNQGICIMGACSCRPGFSGSDCSQRTGHSSDSDWWESFWWLGVIGFMCAFTGLFATFWMIQRAEWADRTHNRNDTTESLLHWIDVEGSAGSDDTAASEKSGDRSSVTPSVDNESLEEFVDTVQQSEESGLQPPTMAHTSISRDLDGVDYDEHATTVLHDVEVPPAMPQEIEVEDSHYDDDMEKTGDEPSNSLPLLKPYSSHSESRTLNRLLCSVCMNRQVQVALVPCGHSNLCRRCSRKLQRCPFCRKEIVRRQRLYLSG